MPIITFPGDDDHYEDVDFSEPPENPEDIAEMWRAIAEASRERQRRESDRADKQTDTQTSTLPELHDHDAPKRDPSEFEGDPRHDALMSNPDLREAYTRLQAEGYSVTEAHYYARKEVFGDDWEPDVPEYYEGIDRITDDSTKSEEKGASASDENGEVRSDDTTTLADFGDDS